MSTSSMRILVVDDDYALAELLRRILLNEEYDVVVAHTAEEALQKCQAGHFGLALVDVMLPGMDGFTLCRRLRQNPSTQYMPILMLTAKGDIADKISGFEAGADDYLTKPFQPKELTYRIRSLLTRAQMIPTPKPAATEEGRVVVIFGSKGGVGKTTIATNLAVALRQRTDKRVALFDADFFFGDVGVHLNLPTVRTFFDLVENIDEMDSAMVEQALIPHSSGIRVLLSPFRPEEGERVTAQHVEKVIGAMTSLYDFVVVDCQPAYDERMLTVLRRADEILLIVTPEVGPLKNTSIFLDLVAKLGFSLDKIHIVLNRFNSNVGIGPEEIERTLQHEVAFRIISGGRPVVLSVNRGVPLVIEQPDHPFSMQIHRIADQCIERAASGPVTTSRSQRGFRHLTDDSVTT